MTIVSNVHGHMLSHRAVRADVPAATCGRVPAVDLRVSCFAFHTNVRHEAPRKIPLLETSLQNQAHTVWFLIDR